MIPPRIATAFLFCLTVTLTLAYEPVVAQTLPQIEQRWSQGERRQLLPDLRGLRPRTSGDVRNRVDFMLAYVLCEGNDLAERREGFSLARNIRTAPRPPWTAATAARIDRLRRWCGRPVSPVRTARGGSAPQAPVVVLRQDWTSIRINDRVLSLSGVQELGSTELMARILNPVSATQVFRDQPAGSAPVECEEQIIVLPESQGTAQEEEEGVLCIQGLWTQNGQVIFWEGDPTLPPDWETTTLAELPPAPDQ
jgi:hypothetical protein